MAHSRSCGLLMEYLGSPSDFARTKSEGEPKYSISRPHDRECAIGHRIGSTKIVIADSLIRYGRCQRVIVHKTSINVRHIGGTSACGVVGVPEYDVCGTDVDDRTGERPSALGPLPRLELLVCGRPLAGVVGAIGRGYVVVRGDGVVVQRGLEGVGVKVERGGVQESVAEELAQDFAVCPRHQ